METITIAKSIIYFLIAGLFEIGGGFIALAGVTIIMYWPRS